MVQVLATEKSSASHIDKAPDYRGAIAIVILVGLGYYIGAKVGFLLTFQPHPTSTLWPPNSILLAALLLIPKRRWWLVLAAALSAHILVQLHSGVPLPMVLCWFVSNCCEALIGVALIWRLTNGTLRFQSSREVGAFLFAAIMAPFLSSFLDAGFVVLNGWGQGNYWTIWSMRFFSNVLAELTLVPFIVTWANDRKKLIKATSVFRFIEAAALIVGLLLVTILVLGGKIGANPTPSLLYLPLPFLLWAAVRFGPKGISTSFLAVAFFSIWGGINGVGPFASRSPEENTLSVQLSLIVIFIPLLFLAAVIEEQKRLRELSRKSEEQLELALDAAQMGTWDWHVETGETKWSDHTKRMFGFRTSDVEVPPEVFYQLLHEDDRQRVEDAISCSIRETGPYASEFRLPQPDGSVRWIRGEGKVLVDDAGKPLRMVGVNVDITTRKQAEEQLSLRNRQIRTLAGRLISIQESERRRISRELHDELSQRVAALSIAISRLKRRIPQNEQETITELERLNSETYELASRIRQLSHELNPASLEHLGLEKSLAAYADRFQREENIETSFSANLDHKQIPSDVAICVYRVTIEGLRNIAKHSESKSAWVLIDSDESNLLLEVTDVGKGFDIESARNGAGIGIASAEERVRLLGGKFQISSALNSGTKIVARIPLTQT